VYDVGALGPSFRFCRKCVNKEGPRNLRRDSNVALMNVKSRADKIRAEVDELNKRYAARFNTTIKFHLPS
jgi:hypothetical protein